MKYCVVGNIVKEHKDENNVVRYGTKCFPGGRKVYISRRLWDNNAVVLGLNRFGRYVEEAVPLDLIENIRFAKAFKPGVLRLMNDWDGAWDMWWQFKEEDKIGAIEHADLLNRIKNGDKEAFEQYDRDVMSQWR